MAAACCGAVDVVRVSAGEDIVEDAGCTCPKWACFWA